ncbi:agap001401-PA, related [Neospora caninum Liverpool]|uniref:Agap001401-PA, related n=1 Tax=Neospora caninum (strain Liverpool) TaxID=572307 RepID=F0V9E0_NEOCL|nr:agap001401-PA, related [Neospora caninum Liverpool]CBZ50365.1 agap001401-PA, related [Neospora caninum Liverpool]CEL64971.1 TPA: AGAP001401-PA, related [Neospora caninum Liverpool]|eukprot:XP_003880399.1 agap001401-PA, related [Neospora caninum Liverpool]
MVFPAAKLFSVAIRQLSKPMASYMQKRAQNSDGFKAVCVGIASRYNGVEQLILNRFYGRSNKSAPVRKLNEAKAIQLGATVFGEFVIFGIAAVALGFEYRRSLLKEAAKERELLERLYVLEAQILQLQAENDRVLTSLFPHEKHAREEVDVNIDQGRGWLSWLAQPITGLFVSPEGGAKGDGKVSSVQSAQDSGSDPSRHIPPPPDLARVLPKHPAEVGSVSLSFPASTARPTFPPPKASDVTASLPGTEESDSRLAAELPHVREQGHSGSSNRREGTSTRLCEALPITDQDVTKRDSSSSKGDAPVVPKLAGARATADVPETDSGPRSRE